MSTRRQGGISLVELVLAIVIVSIGLTGVIAGYLATVKDSANPMIRKQMLAIAEEMLEEISLKPFAATGTPPTNALKNCTTGTGVAPRTAFNDVADYNNYSTTGICNIDGDAIQSLAGYSLSTSVSGTATLGGLGGGQVQQITVTVTHGTEQIRLVGWRTNYAPP
ncbi:MAG TPA: prepilin-type N-terminal cleavage/methylation domain-containing protein [Noviherbaspirillum sp.]|nr:prepilin-type N-terminal cleavage/methylation domain-containing protein [Noviherbaspirillum sp.]